MSSYKSKTIATWLSFLGGGIGLGRFYLYGLKDVLGWIWAVLTFVGLFGLRRHLEAGQDDQVAWLLLPVLGFSLSAGALCALIYGLMPDEKWNAKFNPNGPEHQTGWATVIGIVASLLVGGGILMSAIAYTAEHIARYSLETAASETR